MFIKIDIISMQNIKKVSQKNTNIVANFSALISVNIKDCTSKNVSNLSEHVKHWKDIYVHFYEVGLPLTKLACAFVIINDQLGITFDIPKGRHHII